MHELKRRWARFTLRNQNKGIPNLMYYIIAVKILMFLFTTTRAGATLEYYLFYFPELILRGEIWRMFTYVFLPDNSNILFFMLSILFYIFAGRMLEYSMGRFRFNLFYFSNILICSTLGLILHGVFGMAYAPMELFAEQSLLFALATVNTETVFLFMFFIPLKVKHLAWVWCFYLVFDLFSMPFPMNCMAVLCLIPYFLFFGKQSKLLLPDAILMRTKPLRRPSPTPNWADKYQQKKPEAKPYHHKCTVCGRTDVDSPNLEFRYCSRCKGYYCYCSDHINNHIHI